MLTNTAVTNFHCHKLIVEVNKQKNSDMKNLFAIGMEKNSLF